MSFGSCVRRSAKKHRDCGSVRWRGRSWEEEGSTVEDEEGESLAVVEGGSAVGVLVCLELVMYLINAPAHATASQSATQNGPPPPSTPHEQATQITHGTESSQPVHQNLIPQPTRGRPFSRQKLQHRREAVWKP
ncbi:hypothetical protein DEO72_LG3g538 [Vigna unguiculata]|uniref:Uncharacterized protein n=1 Tax=Vigna unguiculata TaxID=3917 RepID=A0A4D6LBU1_VIGUN|nr:hypothetical protein DEO72_LG3g538 [Vigna unguiculata]